MIDYAVMNQMSRDEARRVLTELKQDERDEMRLPETFRPAIELAIHSHDQLRYAVGLDAALPLSFDQTAVEAVARMHGIDVTPPVARDLGILQAEGLRILREAA